MRTVLRRAAITVATLATVVGGGVVMAPTASAADSGSCTWSHKQREIINGGNVNFRTGPSTKYTSKGIVTDGTEIYVACGAKGYAYVRPLEGAHKGEKGWVDSSYVSGLFN